MSKPSILPVKGMVTVGDDPTKRLARSGDVISLMLGNGHHTPTHRTPRRGRRFPMMAAVQATGPRRPFQARLIGVVAEALGGVGLLVRRGLVPEPRQESSSDHNAPTGHGQPAPAPAPPSRGRVSACLMVGGRAFDVHYDGIHQPSENARQCRTCRVMTTWPHLFCSACTLTEDDTGCPSCRPSRPPPVGDRVDSQLPNLHPGAFAA